MKKVMWGALFVYVAILIIMMLLFLLQKEVPDFIAGIQGISLFISIFLAIGIQRENYLKNKL